MAPINLPEDLEAVERLAITLARRRAPDRVLNVLKAQRADASGFTADGVTKSLNQWSRDTGIPRGTIAARISYGWTPEQVVGVEPTSRDRATEHLENSIQLARVVVMDEDRPMTVRQAAAALNCREQTLRERLVKHRIPEGQARVQLGDLRALSDKHRRLITTNLGLTRYAGVA